jgi:NAD(P)-dependent dehydrogenase (short-subunit alcohol dehydrogenase family)
MMRFEGKRALVTGAARGIGAASAARLGREGARVAVVDRLAEAGEATARELVAAGVDARFLAADVGRPDEVERVVAEVSDAFGGLDVLVNNAAITLPKGFEATTPLEWDAVLGVNLRSTYLFLRAAAPHLRRVAAGSVVNVSSFHARSTLESFGAYAAAKAGVIGLTRSAALDLAPHGVRVNAVCPGIVETAMWQAWMEQVDDAEAATAEVLARQPLGRIGRPEEIAAAIAFLASEDAAYITGTELYVDGGVTARLHHVAA